MHPANIIVLFCFLIQVGTFVFTAHIHTWFSKEIQLSALTNQYWFLAFTVVMVMLLSIPSGKSEDKPKEVSNMTPEQLKLFYQILETKNSWGKNEIRTVLLEVTSGIRTTV